MRTVSCCCLLLLALAGTNALAAGEMEATAVVCTGVENRTPQGAGKEFPKEVGELFCFSEVRNGQGSVTHVWFYQDREVARIELPVKGPRFRTWSKKRIPPSWTGEWRVEVRSAEGLLAQAAFAVR